MAVEHGKPGLYAKTEASRHLDRYMRRVVVAATAGGAGIGFASAVPILTGRRGFWAWAAGIAALVAVGAAVLRALRLLDGPLRRIGRERIKYYRGAQGEALVGWLLQDLPGDWHVFHGMQLEEASDLDHVVVGPGGLFCVSTKSNRGLLSAGADGAYLLNGKPTEFVRQVQRQTMRLRDRLAALLGRVPWVQPVLAVPLAWVAFDSFQSAAWVLHQDNLLKALSEQPPRLGPDEVARVVRALEMIMANAKDLYERPVPRAPGGGEPAAGPGGDTAAKA